MPRKKTKKKAGRSKKSRGRSRRSKSKQKKSYIKEPKVKLHNVKDFSKCSEKRISRIIDQLTKKTPMSILEKIARDLGIPIGGLNKEQLLNKIRKYELPFSPVEKKLSF